MFGWITRLLRRGRNAAGAPASEEKILEEQSQAAPASARPDPLTQPGTENPHSAVAEAATDRGIRTMDYALLITDSAALEKLPEGDRYPELARQKGGIMQPTVSGLTLILFEPGENGQAAPGRIEFARELEKKSLARIRCLHGQALAIQNNGSADGYGPQFTLQNFHVLVQHAAALDLGKVTEAGSYHASKVARKRR